MWNPIGASPAVDPKNDSIVSMLAQPNHSALLYAYGNPIYEATSSTPRYSVAAGTLTITNVGADKWGDNDLAHHSVAIPDAMPSAGTDGKFVVIDRAQGLVFDMWQAHRTASGWAVSWGGVYPLNGDGSSHNPSYQNGVPWMQPVSRGTGAGLSTLFGTIRLSEIRESQINHALVFATDMACGPANTGPFRWPATTTDGNGRFSVCIPQGARVQLDPTIDLYAIPGITRGELTVGLTLQRYGAYANDNGGCRMCIVFEVPPGGEKDPANPYPAAGFAWDYYDMNHLPWGSLRVLNAWDGS